MVKPLINKRKAPLINQVNFALNAPYNDWECVKKYWNPKVDKSADIPCLY